MYGRDFSTRFESRRKKMRLIQIAIITAIVLILIGGITFRFDFAAGSHKIVPTACDQTFFGNWQVYYKTSQFEKDVEESYYYIQKGNDHLVKQVNDAILSGSEIVIYYDRWVGFKGITSPREAPIVRIELVSP